MLGEFNEKGLGIASGFWIVLSRVSFYGHSLPGLGFHKLALGAIEEVNEPPTK